MKTVLCYGDSLTWGYDAAGPGRHALEDRWPSVLQAELGEGVEVIAEGLNGRTTAFDDNLAAADRNGARLLPTILGTHAPIDVVVIMLGANDMKPWIHGNPLAARQGMARLVSIVRSYDHGMGHAAPEILLVSPPAVSRTENAEYKDMFAGGDAASKQLAPLYAALADEVGCGFFDAGSIAETTPLDGVHLDAQNTRAIGTALAPIVRVMLEL
ncbi:SGNH/GDSL hydrolase family protein [Aminobacter sp. NyZ550]|uniref:Lysophospholipase L1-like esterase n=1 Tax=Aminobacter ciceronei TaxID=150723 RepID=A0ABR6CHN1_9HYPH|nr:MULTISPECIES: SGNH/GDSL hydrolase family protein [Aminobacter]WMC99520.1 SGNH/GDSL hydrolase family protein [Aminobacter aminovorans]MBA8910369.1 lysophospholipase L1-like esterase [Aminobacter ciceronei]MBA9024118.1 lysophospholipase L1-like esterase [Aminobacter ciceronei]MRX36865.1 arylesterase [Aminobacter sp. MDW-2]QNH32767.1 SGNH/GDSL hydrolase family protein [Aminobacter sp. MDW-2]